MRSRDSYEGASIGAEAIPGGLSEINKTRHGLAGPTASAPSLARKPPFVGLIALVRIWRRFRADRR
jgi:hypothetical protein